MKSFITQAQCYAAYHQKDATRYTHFIGVPLLILSLMILLDFLHLVIPPAFMDVTLATIATLALIVFYLRLYWRLALAITPILILLLWVAHLITYAGLTRFALWAFIITFGLGWALQLIGHLIEGKRPALITNLYQALIAPLFLTAEVFFKIGRMQGLKQQIYDSQPHILEHQA